MRQYPVTARKRQHEVTAPERHVWSLIWRSHDLGEMLAQLPDLTIALRKRGQRAGKPYLDWLRGICGVWTVYVRYSTKTSTMDEARAMLDRVRELKDVLR
jgi:hypothetical protein